MFCSIHSFQGILRVHFGEIGWLNTLLVHYATASRFSQLQAQLDLLIDCYLWAFHLYHQERTHIQHCQVILTSFAWVRVAIGISDHSRKGWNPDGEPSRCKTKNTKPRNTYNVVKYAKDFEKGNTIMKNYGNPQRQMCRIGSFLSEVYGDAILLNLVVGEPKPRNLAQIHDEVMKNWNVWHTPDGVMSASVGTPYPSVVRPQPYASCTLWRSYKLLVLSPP